MSLTAKDVEEITRLLEESSFDELHLEINGIKLNLRRASAGGTAAPGDLDADPSTQPAPPAQPELRGAAAVSPAASDPDAVEVRAPLLGTFYRAPKPGAAPFVEVGALVEPDSIIGIIEVMKLMNAVRAGVRGTVTEILGRDGVLVEYGETLVRVSLAG